MSEFCIVEKQVKSLPDHWQSEGVTTDQRRVMETFESREEAEAYREENYGMYRSDAAIERVESLDVLWKDD